MSETRQIHHVRTIETWRYVEDEHGMMQKKPVQRFTKSDVDRITYGPTGETFEVSPDGSFYLPVEVAEFMTRQPDWHPGPSPFAPDPVDETPRARKARAPKAEPGAVEA